MPRLPEYNDDYVKKNQKRYKLSSDYCEPYFERFLDNYKHYFIRTIDEAIEADSKSYPFYSNLMLPISYQIVETILPRMFTRMLNFSLTTDQPNDQSVEVRFKQLLKYQMNHPYLIDDPIFARLVNALKEELITGNSWGEVPWYMKEVETTEWQPYSIQMGIEEPSWENLEKIDFYGVKPDWKLTKVTKKVIDAPVYVNHSIFHVFPDPKKKRVSDLGYTIIEEFKTMEEIMDMVNQSPGDYKNIETFQKMKAAKEYGSATTRNYDEEMAGMFGSQDYATKDTEEGQYKVWFVKEAESYGIIINEKLCIRQSENPNGDGKLGLMLMKDIPVPGELFAWGEPDPIKKIEDSMSDQGNMRSDSVFYDLMRIWKLDPQALVDGEEFTGEPGEVVQMKRLDGLQVLDTGVTKASSYKEYDEWDKVLQSVSGVTDYASGQVQPGMNDTKGGVEALQAAANARFSLKLQLFEQLGLKSIGTMYVQRNLRFYDEAQWIGLGKQKSLFEPDEMRRIRGNVNFMVDTGSTESQSKQAELQKWTAIIGAQGKPPFERPSEHAKDKMRKGMLYALGEDNDVDALAEQEPLVPPAAAVTADPTVTTETPAVDPALPVTPAQNANVQPTTPTVQPNPAATQTQ